MPRLLLLLLACAPLTGCYVLHTAKGQFDVMRRREPITEVIADPHTEPKLRTRLERVLAIREFAVKELALPDNGSYRTYADIQLRWHKFDMAWVLQQSHDVIKLAKVLDEEASIMEHRPAP